MAETTGVSTPVGALPARTNSRTLLTSDDPDVIRSEIARTRAEMSRTIDMLQERLTVDNFKEQAVDTIREATRQQVNSMTSQAQETMRNMPSRVMENVRANPMPYALIGVGIGWLLMSRPDGQDYERREVYPYSGAGYGYAGQPVGAGYGSPRYGQSYEPSMSSRVSETMSGARVSAEDAVENVEDRVREVASAAQRKADDVTNTLRETVEDARSNVSEMTTEASHRLQHEARMARQNASWQATRVRSSVSTMMDENPLVLGVAALVAGTLIGLMLPSTSVENELLGDKRDQLMNEARSTAEDVMQRAQRVAQEARQAAVSAAEEEARRQDLPTPGNMSGSQM